MNPPLIHTPRPVSRWDKDWNDSHPEAQLGEGVHYVPGRGLVTSETLHVEAAARPGRPLQFTLADAGRIKNRYWAGESTIAELARERKVTEVTISRLVHGKTYWWA